MKLNNFKSYKENQQKINTNLVKKAIKYLQNSGTNLSNNKVSHATYLLAESTIGEKGITPSAISKNKTYSSLITQAKYEKQSSQFRPTNKLGTEGDIRMELFKTKVQNEKLKQENITLKELLQKYGGDINTEHISKIKKIEDIKLIKKATQGLIQRLFELGLVEQNINTGNLVLAQLGDILLHATAYKLIIGDE